MALGLRVRNGKASRHSQLVGWLVFPNTQAAWKVLIFSAIHVPIHATFEDVNYEKKSRRYQGRWCVAIGQL